MVTERTSDDAPENELRRAQMEQLQLQNKRLKLEVEELEKPWQHVPPQTVPMIAALVAVAGFWWGVFQYREQQAENRAAEEKQSIRLQKTSEQELMKPWLDNQRETYVEALSVAATLANDNYSKSSEQANLKFWQLYHGRMIMVETKSVSDAMVAFGNCLNRGSCNRDEMNKRCRALATAMAGSMAATAKMTYDEFAANQFHYRSIP